MYGGFKLAQTCASLKAAPERDPARSAASAARQAPIACAEPLSEWAASCHRRSDGTSHKRSRQMADWVHLKYLPLERAFAKRKA